ncbi:MAG: hypothetical protein JOZ47_22495 [Kutzneria sp.]|nr:hypothetical protein [Kutzneria sp.]MBV9847815.1 hypothetical protein [Kutzneria sp.]
MAKQGRRALVPTGMVILAVLGGVNYFLSPVDTTASTGGNGSGVQQSSVFPQSPRETVRAVYHYIAAANPDLTCALFMPSGAKAFATDFGADNCRDAVTKISNRTGYDTISIPDSAVATSGTTATVDSCQFTVEGGQRLGEFTLTKRADSGWAITGHKNSDPPDCLTG